MGVNKGIYNRYSEIYLPINSHGTRFPFVCYSSASGIGSKGNLFQIPPLLVENEEPWRVEHEADSFAGNHRIPRAYYTGIGRANMYTDSLHEEET